MQEWFESVGKKFVMAFVEGDRWKLYIKGLGVTLEIALFAAIIGLLIGTVVALMRLSTKRDGKKTIWARIAGVYIDVIRGTPSVLQLLIMWFVIMKNCHNGILVAVLSFGINSGAYVSEIVRAGILAVDKGQTEAGRSLGLSKAQTMIYIVIPQAIKNVLPPIGNEFIVLLKETAIVGYVSLTDLTRAANQITSRTYEAFMPLIGAAVIYFTIIKILTILLERLERRLRKSDNR
ncbi:MAG: amino acid ABC transporter permease [Lachnospiraceae bacterium]|nr:amino acid ABC transporter permease [Lachnospiraceae bacterium]MDD7627412.1 amino acid ABC transporter permease [Lachnospiraceae bacterium]MDY4119524.1 amino acid ABC transporter permease [Lachnospiraceae bacterium]